MSHVDIDRILYSIEAARNLAAGGKPGLDCVGVCWNVGMQELDEGTKRKAREIALDLCKTRYPLVAWCSAAYPIPGGVREYRDLRDAENLWSGERGHLRRLYAACLADALEIIYMSSTDSNTGRLIPPHYLDGVSAVATASRDLYNNGPSFADVSKNFGVCTIVGMLTLAEYIRNEIRGRALVIAKREYPKIRWATPIFPIPGGAGAYYNCETRWSSRRSMWRLAYARCVHLACIDFIEVASYKVGMIDGNKP